jgi:hypothetical protein
VALPSFTADLVERNAHPTEEEEDIYKWTSTAFYSGRDFFSQCFELKTHLT